MSETMVEPQPQPQPQPEVLKDIVEKAKKELIEQIIKYVIAGIVAAVLAGGAAVWVWVSTGGIVKAAGGVTREELPQRIADEVEKKKDDLRGPPGPQGPKGPPGAFAGKISWEVVRFGQQGSSEGGNNEGEPFVQLLPDPRPQRVVSATDFPICEVTEIRVRADVGSCALVRNPTHWEITVTGVFACKVTCFRPVFSQ